MRSTPNADAQLHARHDIFVLGVLVTKLIENVDHVVVAIVAEDREEDIRNDERQRGRASRSAGIASDARRVIGSRSVRAAMSSAVGSGSLVEQPERRAGTRAERAVLWPRASRTR